MKGIKTDIDRTTDQETVTTAKTTTDNTLFILDLRKIISEIAHKALRIKIGARVLDPVTVDPRTTENIQGNDNMIKTISKQVIVSRTVYDRIMGEVTVLTEILEITAENVIQTEINSEILKLTDFLWTINKKKLISTRRGSVQK